LAFVAGAILFIVILALLFSGHVVWSRPPADVPDFRASGIPAKQIPLPSNISDTNLPIAPPAFVFHPSVALDASHLATLRALGPSPFIGRLMPASTFPSNDKKNGFAVPPVAFELSDGVSPVAAPWLGLGGGYQHLHPMINSGDLSDFQIGDVRKTRPIPASPGQ
jgi:hypothetical protein